jgi:hypothetical protein
VGLYICNLWSGPALERLDYMPVVSTATVCESSFNALG